MNPIEVIFSGLAYSFSLESLNWKISSDIYLAKPKSGAPQFLLIAFIEDLGR